MRQYDGRWKALVGSGDEAPARYVEPGAHPEAAESSRVKRCCVRKDRRSSSEAGVLPNDTAMSCED